MSATAEQTAPLNDSVIPARRATFRAATLGLRAYTIALRLRDAGICPGVDFRDCTKAQICEEFTHESGFLRHLNGQQLRDALRAA